MKGDAHIILNPVAGGGKGEYMWRVLRQMQGEQDETSHIHVTNGPGHATQLARALIQNGRGPLIVAGGDGTINEVVNGMMLSDLPIRKDCKLGILNCGSGAGVAQTLGLPANLMEQLQVIDKGNTRSLDVGEVCYRDETGEMQKRLFISECQIGIGGSVVSGVGMQHKRFGGRIAFGSVAVAQLFRIKGTSVTIQVDDRPPEVQNLIGIVVGNGRYCAGGMQLTPGALPDDGLLDVLRIADMGLLNRLLNFSKVYSGTHVYSGYFSLDRARKIRLDTAHPLWVEADGELLGETPCSIRLLHGRVEVFVP